MDNWDDEVVFVRKKYKNPSFDVAYETKQGYVKLTSQEWQIFQDYIDRNENNLEMTDFKDLPKKVRLLIRDWLNSRKRMA